VQNAVFREGPFFRENKLGVDEPVLAVVSFDEERLPLALAQVLDADIPPSDGSGRAGVDLQAEEDGLVTG